MTRVKVALGIASVVVLTLAACDGSGPMFTQAPVATPTPAQAAAPTSTTPPPTPTPTPSPTPTLTPTPAPAQVPGPQEVTDAHLAAFNAGDIESLRDIYGDDVVFTLGNLPYGPAGQPITNTYTGKGAVIGEHLEVIAANVKITLSNTRVTGNTVRGRFSYTDHRSGLGDAVPLTGILETVAEGGKLTSLTMTFDEETYQRWKAFIMDAEPLQPIVVDEGAIRQEVMAHLPASEVKCIRQSLGEAGFGQYSRSYFSEGDSKAEDEALSGCLSNESVSRFLIGFAVSGLGGLGDTTIACMGNELSGHDLRAIFSSETAWGEAFQAMAGCLSDEERARAKADGVLGDGGEEEPKVEQREGSPGLVDVGGRQLYLICEGEGSPTVVMEAGDVATRGAGI